MEPVEVLRAAMEAVEGAGIPADLRPLAFTTAVDLVVSGRSRSVEQFRTPLPLRPVASEPASASVPDVHLPVAAARSTPSRGGVTLSAGAPATLDLPPSPDRPLAGIDLRPVAMELGVPVERLDRLYDAHSGVLELCGDPSRFGRTRAERVGTVALLLLAALRWSGRDAGSPVSDAVVRAEVARLGLLDVGNYSKHLAARRSLWASTGSGRTATYRLRYDGVEEARRLARGLLEDACA